MVKFFMNGFGARLRNLRNESNLTQKKIAEMLNVTVSTFSHWECDYQEPSFKDLISIGKFFNVSADYLLGLEDELGASSRSSEAAGISAEELNFIEDLRKLTPEMHDILRTTLNAMIKDKIEA